MRRCIPALLLLVRCAAADDADGAESSADAPASASACWQHETREACELEQAETCTFVGDPAFTYADGECVSDDAVGWCAPQPFTGLTVYNAWWEPSSGRVVALDILPGEHPVGWEVCAGAGEELCDTDVEACHACFCEP